MDDVKIDVNNKGGGDEQPAAGPGPGDDDDDDADQQDRLPQVCTG